MGKAKKAPRPSEGCRNFALYVAMVVRNAMEDFHCRYLSDEQMKELNPIIRNAIYTAFHALKRSRVSEGAQAFVDLQRCQIPNYWEEPELLEDYLEIEALLAELDDEEGLNGAN